MATPDYTIHGVQHFGWNNALEPVHRAAPGAVIEFEAVDASGGQLSRQSGLDDVVNLDFAKVNPVTGPVYIEGAEPGDVVKITMLEFKPSGWGWTAVIPGFGLLADRFADPALHIWEYDASCGEPAAYLKGIKVPLKPFPGTVGLAPAEAGEQSVVNPRRVGGNMDTRDLAEGSVLYLPVEVPGGLLSIGDAHAAQGDGEVCGTAIESPMRVVVRLDLIKGMSLNFPRFTTPGPVTRHLDDAGYEVTMGVGPDLMNAARCAVGDMVDFLAAQAGLSPAEAYMLSSVCGDLRISEIVDAPNWIVSFYLPRKVLGG